MSLAPNLTLGRRWTLVGGKGGVGKTTVAAALAAELADVGERVTLVSTDPAHSLGDALEVVLGPDPTAVSGRPGLSAFEIDADTERERFLAAHGTAIATLLERGTYLDPQDVGELTRLTIPGMDELAALLRLARLGADGERLVIDTAPTGHTLRLLALPVTALAWLDALEAMENKHLAVAVALAGGYRPDEVDALLADLRADLARFSTTLQDPVSTRFVLVTNPGEVVLAETRRYAAELAELGVALGGIVVNRAAGAGAAGREVEGVGMVYVPRLSENPAGLEGLRGFSAAAAASTEGAVAGGPAAEPGSVEPTTSSPAPPSAAEPGSVGVIAAATGAPVSTPFAPPTDHRLYLTGGKGGVGKTTSAAAIAIHLAERRAGRVLLLSVDPAGSLAEVLGEPVGAEAEPVRAVPSLDAQQLDAEAAWADFQAHYRAEVEGVFGGLLGGGMSASHDREVVQRLVDLAPPGLDELMALMEVVDTSEEAVYGAIVIDTAPTGHLLRLLEMPDLALEWTHTLLRLLLKYREVTGLGGLAERVLKLSRTLKELRALLTDPDQAWFLAVALPETLSVPETERLLRRLGGLSIPLGGVLVNRGDRQGNRSALRRLRKMAGDAPIIVAPDLANAPVGVEALRGFLERWRSDRGAIAAGAGS